jgi:hypothetical protein
MTTRCQFPEGDPRAPDYRICGEPVERLGCPYCERHCAIAYRRERRAPTMHKSRRPLICLTTTDEGESK